MRILCLIFAFFFLYINVFSQEEKSEAFGIREIYRNPRSHNATIINYDGSKENKSWILENGVYGLKYDKFYICKIMLKDGDFRYPEYFAYDTVENVYIKLTGIKDTIDKYYYNFKNEDLVVYSYYEHGMRYGQHLMLDLSFQYKLKSLKQELLRFDIDNDVIKNTMRFSVDSMKSIGFYMLNNRFHMIVQKTKRELNFWHYVGLLFPRGGPKKWKRIYYGPKYDYVFNPNFLEKTEIPPKEEDDDF